MKQTIELELRKFVAPEYIFGNDARLLAANYCKKLGVKKLFLATDNFVNSQAWFKDITNSLNEEGIESVHFTSISPNPRDFEVMEGAEIYRSMNCNMILAIGGGSVMDCAKGIGIVASNGGNIRQFEGVDKISRPIPPLICIPSTGGTSADVSQFAIISNSDEKYKMAIISKAIVPDLALIDPTTLITMDPFLTACTGMDALSHAFEAFVSNASAAFTDLYALEAIDIINNNLLLNLQEPENIQARGKIMLASMYAGLAFSNASLGCIHSMAHSLGGYLDLAHGECNAILLPHVVNYNYSSSEERYIKIAKTMGLAVSGLSTKNTRKLLLDHIFEMNKSIGITEALKAKGVTTDLHTILARKAISDPCNATNPRPPREKDLEVIYSEAM